MVKRFKKPLLMALIISLLLPLSHPIQTEADPTAIDPNYQGTQGGGSEGGGRHLESTDTSPYMGFYNSHEVLVLTPPDGSKSIEIPGTSFGQDTVWTDIYYYVDAKYPEWNKILENNPDAQVGFEVKKVYDIYTYNNTVVGYDENGHALYDTAHPQKSSFDNPTDAANYWNSQRETYENHGYSSSGETLFKGSNREGEYDYKSFNPQPTPTSTPTPKPSKTPTPKPSGPIPTGATNTPTPTATATPTPTVTSTPVPTATNTPTPTPVSGGIVYYGNGSTSGYTYRDTCWGGGMFIVSSNTFFRRTGYHWTSWMNKPKDGLIYDVGTPINLPAYYSDNILSLYAQWEKNKSIITFHYKNEDKLKPEDLVKGTYGDSLVGGDIVAVFEDDNAPDVPSYYQTGADDKILVYDEPIGELPAPTMRGYTFCGWSYIDDFYGVWLKPTALVSTWKNTDAYAYWKANVYKINFDYNFDYGLASAETSEGKLFLNDYAEITYGQQIGVGWNDSLPEPQRTGYIFEGWYIAEDPIGNGAGKRIENGYVYDYPMDITLHAKWTPVETTIIYKNILGVIPNGTGRYGEPMGTDGIPAISPVKAGFTFDGWTVSLNPTSRKITADTVCDFTIDPTYLYAQWKPVAFTVTLDYNWNTKHPAVDAKINGIPANITTQATGTVLATYSYAYPTLPIPSREGYQCLFFYQNPYVFGLNSMVFRS